MFCKVASRQKSAGADSGFQGGKSLLVDEQADFPGIGKIQERGQRA